MICPHCGKLISVSEPECPFCGAKAPSLYGYAPALQRLFGRHLNFISLIVGACVVLYVLSLVLQPEAILRPAGGGPFGFLFGLLSPGTRALYQLGMTGGPAWDRYWWWTLFTAIYLHGSLLHILFNVLWIRQLGPAVEQVYGPARLVIIFTVSGVLGFVVSNWLGVPFTVGASGSIFGLLGAMVAFGRRRGGEYGAMVLRQYGQWALVMFVLGFFMSGVNNLAHAGGFVGGFLAGLVLSFSDHREESPVERVVAIVLIAVTAAAFGLAVWTAFVG